LHAHDTKIAKVCTWASPFDFIAVGIQNLFTSGDPRFSISKNARTNQMMPMNIEVLKIWNNKKKYSLIGSKASNLYLIIQGTNDGS
jgi:hypothetical protein